MPRPRKCRCVEDQPNVTYFKPRGIPVSQLEEVVLAVEELEAIRLKDSEGLDQEESAKMMKISRTTFHRVLNSARVKAADALIQGKALKIEGGDYSTTGRKYICCECGCELEIIHGAPMSTKCPKCMGTNVHRGEKDKQDARNRISGTH